VRAIAYAELRPDEVGALGIAADTTAWPGLNELESLGLFDTWSELEGWWRAQLGALATQIGEGHAAVTPRVSNPPPCRTCCLQPLCRIRSTSFLDTLNDTDE
jgi:hypothetical protein